MTQFAYFDSSVPSPSPVIGWYDTGLVAYQSLPNSANLLELTESQWESHISNPSGWAVASGALVAATSPTITLTLQQQAALAINAGITIALSGSITLAATPFPTDTATLGKIANMNDMAKAGVFPTGFTTYPMKDASTPAVWHSFAAAQYQIVAGVIASYVADLSLIADGNPEALTSLPSNSITLAV